MNPEGLSEAKLAPKAFGVNYGQSGVSGHTELAPSEDSEVMIKHLGSSILALASNF